MSTIAFKIALSDTRWLTEHYIDQGLNSIEIGEILGCHPRTVTAALKKAGIPIRSREARFRPKSTPRGPRNMCDKLADEDWLRENWLECFSFYEIGRRAGATNVAAGNRMRILFEKDPSLPREAPPGFHPPSPYTDTLLNDEWLRSAWVELRNVTLVAKRVGCSIGYASTHIKKLRAKDPSLPGNRRGGV